MQLEVAEDPARVRAARREEAGRERVRHHEVPVAPEPRLGQRAVRLLAVEEARRARTASRPGSRRSDARTAARSPCSSRAASRRHVAASAACPACRPHAPHRLEPGPDRRLRVEPEHPVGDVGGVALGAEQAARVAVDLAPERGDVAAQRRRRRGEEGAVVEEPHLGGRGEQLLAHLPVRVRRRLPRERGAEDRRARRRRKPCSASTCATSVPSGNENCSYGLPTL